MKQAWWWWGIGSGSHGAASDRVNVETLPLALN